jgi:hypothetical protein
LVRVATDGFSDIEVVLCGGEPGGCNVDALDPSSEVASSLTVAAEFLEFSERVDILISVVEDRMESTWDSRGTPPEQDERFDSADPSNSMDEPMYGLN